MATRKYNLRDEELPVVGRFVYESFLRDFNDFSNYSPDFNEDYKANLLAKLEGIEGLLNPQKILAEQKKTTAIMYEKIDALRPVMSGLEGYVKRAGDELSILVDDFGISEVREKIGPKEQEGLLEGLKILLQNVSDNSDLLASKGWSSAKNDGLIALRDAINVGNIAQNAKMDERNLLTDENVGVMNDFWGVLRDVMETGQQFIYKHTDEKKADDYTIAVLKGRIRSEGGRGRNNDNGERDNG